MERGHVRVAFDYYENKLYAVELVRNARFESFTIIFPGTFMNHPMIDPTTFADGRRLVTVIAPDHEIPLIDTADIGIASPAAMNDPATFNGVDLHLAGDRLTLPQIVDILVSPRRTGLCRGVRQSRGGRGERLEPRHRRSDDVRERARGTRHTGDRSVLRLAPIDFETWARRQRGLA